MLGAYSRNLGCISTINVVLWERAPYVAALMDGDELVRRSGQVTEWRDQAINSGRPLPKGYGKGPRSGQERHPRRVAALPDLPVSARRFEGCVTAPTVQQRP